MFLLLIIYLYSAVFQIKQLGNFENMKINLLGQRNILGMGVLYENFSEGLKKIPFIKSKICEVDVTDSVAVDKLCQTSSEVDINIWFLPSAMFGMPKGKNVVWAFFESTVLPDVYVNYYNSADVVWAPSNWANSILLKNGVKAEKIHIVPGGVCPATFNPFERKIGKVRDSNVFRFLAIGKYEERKGYTQLFEAFKLAFENNPNVELIVKADCFANLDVKKHELNIKINDLNVENIRIAEGAFSVNDMVALYNYADCFVYPSRAEGWGLPLIEAIACGLPVLATNYSGHGEFLSKIDGYYVPIDYKMVQIGAEFRKLWSIENKHDAFWAEADIVDMASKMRNLVSTRHESKLKANVASDIIRTDFTWQKSIDAGINSISDLLS